MTILDEHSLPHSQKVGVCRIEFLVLFHGDVFSNVMHLFQKDSYKQADHYPKLFRGRCINVFAETSKTDLKFKEN